MALNDTGALGAIEPIIGKGGIHDHRAGVIRCALVGEEEDGQNSGHDGTTSPNIGRSGTMAEF